MYNSLPGKILEKKPTNILVSSKQNKKQAKKPLLGPNYRKSSLAAQPKLFCIRAFRRGLQIACILQSNHTHLTFIK